MIITITIFSLLIFSTLSKRKYMMVYFVFALTILSSISFFYVPSPVEDLYKHYIMFNEFKLYDWNFVLNTHYFQRQPVFVVYVYLISFLPYKEFLPAITIFLTYIFSLSVINKITIKYNLSKKYMILSFMFLLFTMSFLSVMGGIRNMLAFSIFAYALYYDLVENKNNIFCYFTYILLTLFHSSTVILLLIRILLFINNKTIFKIIGLIFLFWIFFSNIIINILNIFNSISFFNMLASQMSSYLSGGSQFVLSTATIRAMSLVVIMIIMFVNKFRIKKYFRELEMYYWFLLLLTCFILGSIGQYDIFVRSIGFIILSSPIMISTLFRPNAEVNNQNVPKLKINKISEKWLIVLILLVIASVSIITLWFNTWSEYIRIQFSNF